MSRTINITRIKAVARALSGLEKEIVFVGGATVSLYTNAATAQEVRPTEDVDVVIELASYAELHLLEEKLLSLGFANDASSGIICRYIFSGITVDIMPVSPEILGFSNQWYPAGFANAEILMLDDVPVKLFTLPYFLASKLEAFKGRGDSDFRYSSDFEDIVYVLENNADWPQQLSNLQGGIRTYLQQTFKELLENPDFEEGVYAQLERSSAQEKLIEILRELTKFIKSG